LWLIGVAGGEKQGDEGEQASHELAIAQALLGGKHGLLQ
jgi:hypothetical protein